MKAMALVAVVLVLASLGGCGRRSEAGSPPAGLPDGRTFVSTPRGDGDFEFRLSFAGDELRAEASCNKLFGQARLAGGRLVVDGLGGTEMGCPEKLMRQDEQLTEFLGSKPVWRLEGDELTLTSGGQEVRLLDRTVADPDRPLRGPKWLLDTIIDGDTASSVPAGVLAYLKFSRIRVGGNDGCNDFGGRLSVRGSQLRVKDIVTTLKACTDDARTEVGLALSGVLGSKHLTYRIEAGRLTLETPAGKGLSFQAA